ncbi:MAG: hypothetical protein E6H66_14950 [Betaproteobacteria bacterium]|nr:MAG: hypothetical protein E6H66_14950 [Betaproteobacteria bacterium]
MIRRTRRPTNEKGITVKYEIDPVVGGMPGHMNVLQADHTGHSIAS